MASIPWQLHDADLAEARYREEAHADRGREVADHDEQGHYDAEVYGV